MNQPQTTIASLRKRVFQSPGGMMLVVTIGNAAIGAISNIIAARWLGAKAYGVIAIISGINATALNLIDVRLVDLMLKWYYQRPPEGINAREYQAIVLQVTLLGYVMLAICFFVIGLTANIFLSEFFTSFPIRWQWAAMNALALALNYITVPLSLSQRLRGRFMLVNGINTTTTILSSGALLLTLVHQPNLDGFYIGLTYGAVLTFIIVSVTTLSVLSMRDKIPLFCRWKLQTLLYLKRESGLLWWGNLLGYVKMAHRASDVLLVGLLTNDQITGVYKLARSFTDKLYIIFDSFNQVYQPVLMRLLANNRSTAFKEQARRLVGRGALLTGLFLSAWLLAYPALEKIIPADQFPGLHMSLIILTLPFFAVFGIFLWTWPLIIYFRLGKPYGVFSVISVLLQYSFGYLFFLRNQSVTSFAYGYLLYYVVLMGLTILLFRHHHPAWLYWVREKIKL